MFLLPLVLFLAFQDNPAVNESIDSYRLRQSRESQRAAERSGEPTRGARLAAQTVIRPADGDTSQPARESLLTQPPATTQPALDQLVAEVPDPLEAPSRYAARAGELQRTSREERVITIYRRVLDYANVLLGQLPMRKQLKLSLDDALRRALEHNYSIRIDSLSPAADQAQLIAAEAAFDAVFFLDTSWANQDPPKVDDLQLLQSDTRSIEGGIRKLLPTGMQAQVSLRHARGYQQALEQQRTSLNPAYSSDFIATLRQPLLRGFGLDYNRRNITLARLARDISQQAYQQQVRDTLFNVEQAYWRLAQARRTVGILAESVAQNFVTYQSILQRQAHDATPVQLNNSLSRWLSREVEYKEAIRTVRDAEDALKNLINDPDLRLSDEIEIVPTEPFFVAALAVDHFAEVRTALDSRSEIEQAKLAIDQARVQTAAAKNETMPQLDVAFTYQVQGLGSTGDNSFDQLTTDRFRSYAVTVNFSYPIGNRGPRANLHRARIQEEQALLALKRVSDGVVTEVNNAIRAMNVRYAQIPQQLIAVNAAERNLRALQARSERIDPNYLETELSAVEQLANARIRLLQFMVEYNIAIIELERAKGTLLHYNNIIVADDFASR